MQIVSDRDAEHQMVYACRPDFFDEMFGERLGYVGTLESCSGLLLWHVAHDGRIKSSGAIFDKLSECVITLAQEILEDVLMFELSIRADTHPLQEQVNKKRYMEGQVQERLDHSRKLLRWAKLLQKRGF